MLIPERRPFSEKVGIFSDCSKQKRAIAKEGFAYLVEGQFDVVTLHKYGVENVIGGSGTAFTDDQVKLIMRFTQSVVMIYDADSAGIKAAVKNSELLLTAGASVRCVRLPKGYDLQTATVSSVRMA